MKSKPPSTGQLAGMLRACRQDLERQGQQVHNLMAHVQALAAENTALRRALGEDAPPAPPAPPPRVDLLGILSRRQQATYDVGMGRPLADAQIAALIADLDTLIAALQASLIGEA